MKNLIFLIPALILIMQGCWLFDIDDDYEFDFETIITDIPANLEGINSDRDDFNSDLPYSYWGNTIIFSSDKPTNGLNFDIKYEFIEITYHRDKEGILNISYPIIEEIHFPYENQLFPLINTDYNEYGPFTYHDPNNWEYFFYSTDEEENLDIRFVYHQGYYQTGVQLYGPLDADILNTEYNDAYPTVNEDATQLLFCSDRDNDQFDIYSVPLNTGSLLHDYLSGSDAGPAIKVSVLSGPGNDKCPSVTYNLLVFASDREGGYGGYDLYYSVSNNGRWTDPVNFGDKINSEFDEYRPIAFLFPPMTDDFIIFSSNRPGGKGGYDLYCVRIGDLIKDPYTDY